MKKHLSLLLSILILTIILFNNLSVYAFSSYTTDPIDTSTLNDLTPTFIISSCIINLCGEISTVFNIIAGIITIIKSTNTIIL